MLRLRLEADLCSPISICTKVSVGSIQKLSKCPRRSALPGPYLQSLMMADWLPVLSAGRYHHLGPPCCAGLALCPSGAQAQGSKQLLWEEYTQRYPNSCYSYSQFCDRYKSWCQLQSAPCARSTRRGKALYRLLRAHGAPSCRRLRVGPSGTSLCRRARCVQLHLLPGHLVPVTAGLAAKPCPCL